MNNSNIKLLIFDFDGTLANTSLHILNCINKCIDKFNLRKLSNEDIEKLNGSVLDNAIKELGAKEEQILDIKNYYSSIFFEDISDIKLYSNVSETLKLLKNKGYSLAIATNRRRKMIIPLLDFLGILLDFDKIVCETDVKNKKPCSDMVELILKELNYSKNKTLVLGDTKFDILMGHNANCKSFYVCHDSKANDNVVNLNPDIIIYDFKELINILDKK